MFWGSFILGVKLKFFEGSPTRHLGGENEVYETWIEA